jgi:hypothetical protein
LQLIFSIGIGTGWGCVFVGVRGCASRRVLWWFGLWV